MGARRSRIRHRGLLAGGLCWLLVGLLLRERLESSMLSHSIVQLPLLALSGACLAHPRQREATSTMALPVLLIALFAGAIWMLPRMLDASLVDLRIEAMKLVSLPLLVGLPLAWSWPRLSDLARAFVWANLISMLLTLGWLYHAAPVRVCNFYLQSEQKTVGTALLLIAMSLVAFLVPRVFMPRPNRPGALPIESNLL